MLIPFLKVCYLLPRGNINTGMGGVAEFERVVDSRLFSEFGIKGESTLPTEKALSGS